MRLWIKGRAGRQRTRLVFRAGLAKFQLTWLGRCLVFVDGTDWLGWLAVISFATSFLKFLFLDGWMEGRDDGFPFFSVSLLPLHYSLYHESCEDSA